ncbi:MAG: hypothetical protein HQK81_00680 [Desulfovibrionaceae bacterium]|nr:hypothetical protein [Desulfovibrionaceae bacterium]MBF0512562.1 hypothetical protein [Desulfovibrionaceae bacterium]
MSRETEPRLREKMLLVFTGRYGIIAINVLLIFVSVLSLLITLPMIFNAVGNVLELEDTYEYLGVILIGYGVAVEERQSFMRIFRLYPAFETRLQQQVDHICHEYGLCFLLLGLFMEMCVACIKIPNTIVNTERIEDIVFAASAFFLTWNTILMLRHCWFMLRANTDDQRSEHEHQDGAIRQHVHAIRK